MKIFIIVPVFNEKPQVLLAVVEDLLALPYEVVVIDDGSTMNHVKNLLSGYSLIVLTHESNRGQGAAIRTGLDFAKKKSADAVVTFDADGQHKTTDINIVLDPLLHDRADVVLGSRFISRSKTAMPLSKRLILQGARYVNFLFTRLLLTDAHNGIRALNRRALEKIHITQDRMAHATEILMEIKKHHLRFIEVPVEVLYTEYAVRKGRPFRNSIRILGDLIKYSLNRQKPDGGR